MLGRTACGWGLLYFTAFDAFGYSTEEKDSMTMATF